MKSPKCHPALKRGRVFTGGCCSKGFPSKLLAQPITEGTPYRSQRLLGRPIDEKQTSSLRLSLDGGCMSFILEMEGVLF